MNERINGLWWKASIGYNNQSCDPEVIEKFAKLIIQECIGVVKGGRFLHDQAPAAIFARECSQAIEKHFGVE